RPRGVLYIPAGRAGDRQLPGRETGMNATSGHETMIKDRIRLAGIPPEAGGSLVLSPHFDAAVLGCGAYRAGPPGRLVLPVCAGLPPPDLPVPDWDRRGGFSDAREAMRTRSAEKLRALGQLRAVSLQMELLDSQYGGQCAGLGARLVREIIRLRPRMLLLPL